MRTIRLCASIAIFASILPVRAQAQFEGTITMRLSSSSGGGEMQYSIKGERLRIDISNGQMGMYILADNGGKAKIVSIRPVALIETFFPEDGHGSDARPALMSADPVGRR
jgi:hypothetical protein